MKILLYSEAQNIFVKSGVGKALNHQIEALKKVGVSYTLDPRDNYNIAHINTIGFGGERVQKQARKKGIPVICHTHTTFEDFRESFLFSNQLSHYIRHRAYKLYKRADYLIFPSKYTKNLLKNQGINTPGEVISNGVDTQKYKKNEELAKRFREKYNLKKPLIICVGLPFERKGVFDFCETAALLPKYDFYWFGARMTALLPRKVNKLIKNPPGNVFFPGYVKEELLLGAFSAASLFFFPTYEENEGIVVLEALSTRCPILLRNIPVYFDWMRDGENCFKGKTNQDFVERIRKIIAKKENLEKMLIEGQKTAKERDLSEIGQKLKKVYYSLLAEVS